MRFHRRWTNRIQNVLIIATHSPLGSSMTVSTISSSGYASSRFTMSKYARTFPEYWRIGRGYDVIKSKQLLSWNSSSGTSSMNKKCPATRGSSGLHGPCKNGLYNSHMPNWFICVRDSLNWLSNPSNLYYSSICICNYVHGKNIYMYI